MTKMCEMEMFWRALESRKYRRVIQDAVRFKR